MRTHYHSNGLIFFVRQRSSDIPIVREVVEKRAYFADDFITVEANDVVVDIGAHIGTFSVLAGSMGAAVISYEPTAINFGLLQENAEINGFNHTLHKQAVRGKAGRDTIIIRPFNYGGNSFFNSKTLDPNFREEVECITLADVFHDNNLDHIDFLKLDCEDSELEILESHPELLPKIRKIAIEWVSGERRKALRDLLSADYELHEVGEDRMGIMLARRKV